MLHAFDYKSVHPHEKKMDLDRRRRDCLDKYAFEFNSIVDTLDVVDHLLFLLPQSAREEIECKLEQKGRMRANGVLTKKLRSQDGWFENLITALRKCGGFDSLVKKLITDKEGSLMPEVVNMESGSPEIDVQSSFGVTRPIAQTSLPNKEQPLEEQATQLTKYNTSAQTRSDSSITELASARNYQETWTLHNTTSHSKMIYQGRCEDVTQPSSYKYRLTQTSFPNKEQTLEEQVTQLRKCATTSQTRPGTSKELALARNYQEKGLQENTTPGKDRKEVKSQTDDEIQSRWGKEELSRDQGNSKAVESKSHKVCKEFITSSIDEKEKDESAVFLEPAVTADEPQQIDKSKDLGVINEAKKQNLSANLINAAFTSPMPACSKFTVKDVDPKSTLEDMSKGCDLSQGACQNGQKSYETRGQGGGVHERSTKCVSHECNGQKGTYVGREVKDLYQLDPVLNRAEIVTDDALKRDDDTELRFFRKDHVKEQKNFSKAVEDEKVILKDLQVLTPTGERNLTKIKELRKISEAGNSRNSYQPLKSNDSSLSHNLPSSQEVSLLVSETSESEALCTYPPKSKIIVSKNEHAFTASSVVVPKIVVSGEETSQAQNNAEFTVQDQTIFRKETEAMEDSHSVARNNVCVESTLVGHEQPMPFKDANDRVVSGDNVIAELPTVREKDAEDDLGCHNLIDSTLAKAGGCKEVGNETEAIKRKAEALPVVKELCNKENEISNDNLRNNEIKEMRSVGIDEIRVKQKDVGSVNDKEGILNDATSYKHDNENNGSTEVISWNPTEQQESLSQPGREIQYINDNDVNGSNTNMESRLEDENGEGLMQLSNGVIGKTVNLIGSMAAIMFGSQT